MPFGVNFGVGVRVDADTVTHQFVELIRQGTGLEVFVYVFDLGLDEDASDGHQVLGESAGLISANIIGSTHSLAGLEVSHQVVLVLHLAHRVGQGDRYGQGQTLGHCHHNY